MRSDTFSILSITTIFVDKSVEKLFSESSDGLFCHYSIELHCENAFARVNGGNIHFDQNGIIALNGKFLKGVTWA